MTRAEFIVESLLEDDDASHGPVLLSPQLWPNFRKGRHGAAEFMRHVDHDDFGAVLACVTKLGAYLSRNELVMPNGKWTMKFTMNYGLLGDAMYGNSILGKAEARPTDSQLIDNPVLSPQENQRWRSGL